mgnify:CR=1 FL=1
MLFRSAGFEEIHKGLTSRDITENIEQLQIKKSLELVQFKTVAVLATLSKLATEYSDLAIAGRSHNVAAQTTTLGKRFASVIEELLINIYKVFSSVLIPVKIINRYHSLNLSVQINTYLNR